MKKNNNFQIHTTKQTPELPNQVEKTRECNMNIIVLISGKGTNLKAILDNNIPVKAVISDRADAPGIKIAHNYGIETIICNSIQQVCNNIQSSKPDLICLAGFMRILPKYITDKFQIMNIHPSLLPHFPGLYAQKQALDSKTKHSGCTVHLVNEKVDDGKIIVQKIIPVLSNDTIINLTDRILQQEHIAYAEAIKIINKTGIPQSTIGKSFKNIDKAIQSALDKDASYLWWYDNYNIVVSAKPPKYIPHIACTNDDTFDIVNNRLNNLININ